MFFKIVPSENGQVSLNEMIDILYADEWGRWLICCLLITENKRGISPIAMFQYLQATVK
jgi:hypothetical protein